MDADDAHGDAVMRGSVPPEGCHDISVLPGEVPEGALLTAITNPARTDRAVSAAGELCRDWNRLLHMATANYVEHQVAFVLKRTVTIGRLPATLQDRLALLARRALMLDLIQVDSLKEIVDCFKRHDVRLIVLKGLGLAERLYDNPYERAAGDLDIMVPRDSLERAGELLTTLGYQPVLQDYYNRRHFHTPYRRVTPAASITVELHWGLVKPGSSVRFDIDRWWHDAYPYTLRAGQVLLPPLEDEITYICHHGFLDGAMTLRGLQDVARWIRRHRTDVDWDEVMRTAQRAGGIHFVQQALRLSDSLWHCDDPSIRCGRLDRTEGRWLARNLLDPSTIVRVGSQIWWPFRHICYWSMLDRGSSDYMGLLTRTLRGSRFMQPERDERSILRLLPRLLPLFVAAALCSLPRPFFSPTFRGDRSLESSRAHPS